MRVKSLARARLTGREPHRGVAMKPRDCQEPHVRNSTNCRHRSSTAAFAVCSRHTGSRSAGPSVAFRSAKVVLKPRCFRGAKGDNPASLLFPQQKRIRGQDRFHAHLGQWPDKLCIYYGVARLQHGCAASTQDRDSREGGGKDQLNPRVSLYAFARSGKSDVVRSGDGRAS